MPRTLRQIVEHDCYHVINRANSGQKIFDSPSAYSEFLSLMEKYARKFAISIYHYVLMPNHFHFLVEPTTNELPRFMQGLTLAHTRRNHLRKNTYGHLWQGRYKCLRIDKDAYFLSCGRYIELNPVRAGLVSEPSEYPWSSYHAYTAREFNSIVTHDQFYLALGVTAEERRLKYKSFFYSFRGGPDPVL